MKKIIAIFMISLALALVGCTNHNFENDSLSIKEITRLDYKIGNDRCAPLALIDDKLVYQDFSSGNGCTDIIIHDIVANNLINIGKINNVITSSDNVCINDNILYTHMLTASNDNIFNTFLSIDLSNNEIEYINNDNEAISPIVNIFSIKYKIYSLKYIQSGDKVESFFETYDTNTFEIKKAYIFPKDVYAITATTYGDKIYVLELKNNRFYIVCYDEEFNILNQYTTELINEIFESQPYKMVIMEDIVYLKNMSNKAVVARFTQSDLQVIEIDTDLEIANNTKSILDPIFYKRNDTAYYLFDENGYLVKNEYTSNDYMLKYMLRNEEKLLVCISNGNENFYDYSILSN